MRRRRKGESQILDCHFRLARRRGGGSAEARCTKSVQKRGYERISDLITHSSPFRSLGIF